jgi:hypothetical protein
VATEFHSGNRISGHSGASLRPSNCAVAFSSHGTGRRLNPYSAHHFPGISRHISAEQEQAPARCLGRVESVHERFARAEDLFSVMPAQRLDHAPQKLNCAQPGRYPSAALTSPSRQLFRDINALRPLSVCVGSRCGADRRGSGHVRGPLRVLAFRLISPALDRPTCG